MKDFFNSQLFGIILGALLTGGFTLLVDLIKCSRDEKLYLKRKREYLYQQMYDFSMRYEYDIRTKKSAIMSKHTKDLWNEIQIESIYGKQDVMETFYDLYEDLENNFKKNPNNIIEVHKQNNKEILDFYVIIKNELGIKD